MIRTVLHFNDNRGVGGAEEMLLILLRHLDQRMWRPVLVHRALPAMEPLVDRARALDVTTWALPRMKGKRDIEWVPAFIRRLRAEKPDVFHAHHNAPLDGTYGLLSAFMARVPAIVVTQHLLVQSRSRRLQQILASAMVDRYIAVSREVARGRRSTCLFPSRKIRVIYNGIPLERFARPVNLDLRARLAGSAERPLVLSLARLQKQKGLCYLLQAAVLVPDAQFVIAGEGPERAVLEGQARSLGVGDRVLFLGRREDIPDLLASCDVFVLPSLYEGLPVSVLEAMAACKPVIGTAIGGTDEAVLHGETGLLVPPRDPEALAAAIRAVLSDRELARRLAVAGRARAYREFSSETMVARTTQIYQEVLSAKGAW